MYSPEDEQLEPENDGLEDDFPLRKGCILMFQPINLHGCTVRHLRPVSNQDY